MKRQKGAALIVVLSLLTVSLMVGLSSMQTSQIDERLAGNYKAASQAQMAAEEAASEGLKAVKNTGQFSPTSLDYLGGMVWEGFNNEENFDDGKLFSGGCDKSSCYYRYVEFDDEYYIVAMAGVGEGAVSVSEPVVVEVFSSIGSGNFASTSVIGSIDDGAIQFPSSSGSELSGGSYESDGKDIQVSAFMFEEGLAYYDMDKILNLGEKAALTNNNAEYFGSDIQARLDLIKNLYDYYLSSGGVSGGSECSGLCFYENGLKKTGNGTLEGVHVVMNGDVQIGGNADVQGVLVVFNLGREGGELSWSADDLDSVEKVKLNGGGNKGTVWFHEEKVKEALAVADTTLEEFFGNSGSGNSGEWIIGSWQ